MELGKIQPPNTLTGNTPSQAIMTGSRHVGQLSDLPLFTGHAFAAVAQSAAALYPTRDILPDSFGFSFTKGLTPWLARKLP
jgi:hypothetical protein